MTSAHATDYILECGRYGGSWNKNGLGANDRANSLNISSCIHSWDHGIGFVLTD